MTLLVPYCQGWLGAFMHACDQYSAACMFGNISWTCLLLVAAGDIGGGNFFSNAAPSAGADTSSLLSPGHIRYRFIGCQ